MPRSLAAEAEHPQLNFTELSISQDSESLETIFCIQLHTLIPMEYDGAQSNKLACPQIPCANSKYGDLCALPIA